MRQNVLSEGKTGKYLKYAIGEILLVIIGILLALQINNWNDQRIERRQLHFSLYSMIEELNQNIQFLEAEKVDKQKRLLTIENFKGVTGSDQDHRYIVFAVSDEIKSKEFNTIYLSLKDEKKLRLIQSPELRNQITTFYEYELAGIREANIWHEKFVGENVDPYILDNIPLFNDSEAKHEMVNDFINQSKFKNILATQKVIYTGYVSSNEKVTQLANDLKTSISSHLSE
ncbi:DUF6090 family protein [Altibacter sp.]|uniref:DUF6090 family protein n=1 Tax=Altibacter sp. TaxID=2024823 RepID=UPI000C979550|nr:DUF6090 family protein [Altibacter sp.]MAP54468.1 hypothetical protein [Altibacter sp.]